MSLQDGIYMIVSTNPSSGHLDFAPYSVPIYPPIYFIIGSLRKDLKEQWKVTSTGNGTYTIYSVTHPRAAWAIRGSTIIASEVNVEEFSIEPAGEGVYNIRAPNHDEVATLESAGSEQLHIDGQDGTDSQVWTFVKVQ